MSNFTATVMAVKYPNPNVVTRDGIMSDVQQMILKLDSYEYNNLLRTFEDASQVEEELIKAQEALSALRSYLRKATLIQ